MLKKHFWKIIILVVVAAIGGSIFYAQKAAEEANEGVTARDHVKGNPDASVVLVEYSDFQCPACGQFYPFVEEIVSEYGEELRFEYRHFPLITIHPNAVPAAMASEAADQQGKFWEMYEKLFEGQSEWSEASNSRSYFIQYAEEIDLDVDIFKRHLGASVLEDAIMADFNEAREQGFTGTPTFLLNGELMKFSTYDEFRQLIVEAVGTTDSEAVAE